MFRRELDEINFENIVRFLILPYENIEPLLTATPNVLNNRFFICQDDVTVTQFLNGSPGQRIHILGNGDKTISDNSNIKTNTGANKVLAANMVYTFTYFPDSLPATTQAIGTWYEDA